MHFRILCMVMMVTVGSGFTDIDKVGRFNIGTGAGFVTGYGLSYRQWIGRYGFQLTAAPFHHEDDWNSTTLISAGATALYIIRESKLINLIGYLGPHFFYHKDTYHNPPQFENYYYENELAKVLFIGGGPGLDFHFSRLSMSFMAGFAAHREFVKKTNGLHFTGETALYYSF